MVFKYKRSMVFKLLSSVLLLSNIDAIVSRMAIPNIATIQNTTNTTALEARKKLVKAPGLYLE